MSWLGMMYTSPVFAPRLEELHPVFMSNMFESITNRF